MDELAKQKSDILALYHEGVFSELKAELNAINIQIRHLDARAAGFQQAPKRVSSAPKRVSSVVNLEKTETIPAHRTPAHRTAPAPMTDGEVNEVLRTSGWTDDPFYYVQFTVCVPNTIDRRNMTQFAVGRI